MPAGPAKLAIETGAALLPVHCWFERRRLGLLDPRSRWTAAAATSAASPRRLADLFATNIAAHPADWHMMQPQWLADLSEARQAWLKET